mgnify:FL=1
MRTDVVVVDEQEDVVGQRNYERATRRRDHARGCVK